MIADYIVVGAGSAGCVIANRLSENPANKVIVLEFGGSDAGPFIQMPAALSYPMNMRRYDWGYTSGEETHLGGRQLALPRGKVLGGSSSINGMVYVRGHALDYERWQEMGAKGWGYADVLPYFQRLENVSGSADTSRGRSGPMYVQRGSKWSPLYDAFIDAGVQAGYGHSDDYNGYRQEGFADMEMTVHGGRRWSAANAYLRPAMQRDNLSVITRAKVLRVLFEGTQAVGVEYEHGGEIKRLRAGKEIILSASAINSPRILLHSGIGDGQALQELGIRTIVERRGVGRNLQDHLELYIQQACTKPITLFNYWNIWSKARIGAQWLFGKSGLGTTNHFESCAFIRSAAGVPYPDIQYHFLPFAVRYDGKAAAEGHGFQAHVGPMRSKSRGTVKLASADPFEKPVVHFNYMSCDEDWRDFRQAIRLTREIFGQDAFVPYRGKEIQPGAKVKSDAQLDAFIKEHVESAFHPCGTCKMGNADDSDAVVDPQGRVIGTQGLRVADSSIFPQITNGNLNGPSLMVGEKIADHILGKQLAPAAGARYWQHPQWQSAQR
ncbi:choline dehydrogenase [Polycladidibacter hongkongensis]|uniref:choline dehydrogenase n=1 Tax=Polycladidibacter hongkongensis TaxID=1647556 RepID=UPI00083770F0|nr:choline dehydrogenase [Pseudovibrio hongkongensis]